MKVIIAVLAVALVLPASALAMPTSSVEQDPPGSNVTAIGTDVAAPDQQSPATGASHLPAIGTDAAAADQQAPSFAPPPVRVVPVEAPDSGFDATDAGMGAAGAAILMCVALGGAMTIRRRRQPAAVAG
jgi:hypothetical protein